MTLNFPPHIVAVSALVTNADDHVLLVKNPRRGWEFPGGQVEQGEDLITAMIRECEEESGIHIEVGPMVGVYTNISPPPKLMFGFLATATGGKPTTSDESEEVGWFPREDVLAMIDHPTIHHRMQDMLQFDGRPIYRVYSTHPYTVLQERWLSE